MDIITQNSYLFLANTFQVILVLFIRPFEIVYIIRASSSLRDQLLMSHDICLIRTLTHTHTYTLLLHCY